MQISSRNFLETALLLNLLRTIPELGVGKGKTRQFCLPSTQRNTLLPKTSLNDSTILTRRGLSIEK